ncbi:MAG: Si-specific NAD(P)(+) transhydrogenase [Bdellovibrionales bacterium]|nr:Si-specific NAD(P)(+) transhydrogenase [Bdellovibrionales bacterium]
MSNQDKEYDYDFLVIGSGPGGQKAAIQAAKLGKRTGIIDYNPFIGGVCLHDGTIPSKSFREAILHLSGYRERAHYGEAYRVKNHVCMKDLTDRCSAITADIEQTVRSQLIRNNVDIIEGFGSFISAHEVRVKNGPREQILSSEYLLISTGTRPRRPSSFEFDGDVILDSDGILHMKRLPKSLCIVGGGVIGCEYGSMFSALGIKVTIVEARDRILGFVDQELIDNLVYTLRSQKATIILNDKVTRTAVSPDGRAVTYLESGKRIVTEKLLISAGRVPNTEKLNLDLLTIERDERGNIKVNENFQTNHSHIYAVGDVIGMPALASTAIEQGRGAACHAFGLPEKANLEFLPYGIFTVPEIGMIGKTERELSEARVPYEIGIARFSEVEKGKILGDTTGVLKLLFHRNTRKVLGIHIIGHSATEHIHIGQMLMSFDGTIDHLVHSVFNFPSLCQAYKTAALDGLNKVISTQNLPEESHLPRQETTIN